MAKLKPLSPIALAIHTIDETIQDLRLKRQELVALLPKQKKNVHDTICIHPITGKRVDYIERGKHHQAQLKAKAKSCA